MITVTETNEQLEITGEMEKGDVVHGLCCEGFDWICGHVIISAWGHCENPQCTAGIDGDDDTYRGVSCWDNEDIALHMIDAQGRTS